MAKTKKWAKGAFKFHKKCSLHKQLKLPCDQKIPITLMRAIMRTPIGEYVRNPTRTGKRRYKVTRLLKSRVIPVVNLSRRRR